jgi:nicotinamidase-related amidase
MSSPRDGSGSPSSGSSTPTSSWRGGPTTGGSSRSWLLANAKPLVGKSYADSFEDTTLETVLSDLRVGRLVVAGAPTDECIRSTIHGAFVTGDHKAPGRTAGTVRTEDVDFGGTS